MPHMKRRLWKAKIFSLCDGCLELQFPSYIKKLGVICLLPIIRTVVIIQAVDVRREFTNTDRRKLSRDRPRWP